MAALTCRVPLISVVMPVRDDVRFLLPAVRSILGQTLDDFEFIIVDDRSGAQARSALEGVARLDPRIRLTTSSGTGIADALNLGIREARAAVIARMDGDDIALPERFETQLGAMQRHGAALVGSACRVIDEAGMPGITIVPPQEPAAIRAELTWRNCILHPTVMMSREAVTSVGLFRSSFLDCEDYDLWVRLSERHDLRNLPEPLLLYRRHAGQATWARLESRLAAEVAISLSARKRRDGEPEFPSAGTPISTETLLRNGLSKAMLDAALRRIAIQTAANAASGGLVGEAKAALAVARRHGALTSRELARYMRVWLSSERARRRQAAAPPEPVR